MRFTATLAVLAGLLASGGTPAVKSPATPTVDEILERNLAALGGRERFRAVRTVRFEATQQAGGHSEPTTVYWKRPNWLRIEVPEEGLIKAMAFDGAAAWTTYPQLPGFEAEPLEDSVRDTLRDQADLLEGPTFDYAAKGHHVELVGKEKVGTTETWRVLLTTAQGELRTYWFDCTSFLEIREERTQSFEGKEFTTVSDLSDFQAAKGILFAHRVESRLRAAGDGPDGSGDPSVFTIQK
ncbi:MAG: hypothetical protein ABIU84_09890, partial [Thermoanaerobaculia bacterium]